MTPNIRIKKILLKCNWTIRKRMPIFFFFNDTATTEIYTLSLHDALPICLLQALHARDQGLPARMPDQCTVQLHARAGGQRLRQLHPLQRPLPVADHRLAGKPAVALPDRSEEHTSELQSPCNLVCRLLLEK